MECKGCREWVTDGGDHCKPCRGQFGMLSPFPVYCLGMPGSPWYDKLSTWVYKDMAQKLDEGWRDLVNRHFVKGSGTKT